MTYRHLLSVSAVFIGLSMPASAKATAMADAAVDAFYEHCPRIMQAQPRDLSTDKELLSAGYKVPAEAEAPPWPTSIGGAKLLRMTRTVEGGSVTINVLGGKPYCSVTIYGGSPDSTFSTFRDHLFPASKAIDANIDRLGWDFAQPNPTGQYVDLGAILTSNGSRSLMGVASIRIAELPSDSPGGLRFFVSTWQVIRSGPTTPIAYLYEAFITPGNNPRP